MRTHKKNRVPKSLQFIIALVLPLSGAAVGQPQHWVTAYYAGWELGNGSNGHLPVGEVDFTAMTDVVHFALVPKPDGSLDSAGNSITFAGSHALVNAAHKAGSRALISVGGWNSQSGFAGATSPENRTKFVMNISLFMSSRGYDGIDIDWEPLNPPDYANYRDLIGALRDAIGPSYLLVTTAGQGYGPVMASVQKFLDQINIMTYDLSFPSPGWITWYNAPLHQHGVLFKSTGNAVPACDNIVDSFIAAGVVREKIGIGVEFGGSVWRGGMTPAGNGVTGPEQSWTIAPSMSADVPYYTIMQNYYTKDRYHWDQEAMASYLSIDSIGSTGDYFISYDDSNDIAAKIAYVRKERLGGIILYELGMGYIGDGESPLLQAVKASSFVVTGNKPLTTPGARPARRQKVF